MEGERVSDMDGWAVDRSRLTERSQVDASPAMPCMAREAGRQGGGPVHTSSTSCLVCLIDDESSAGAGSGKDELGEGRFEAAHHS